MSVAFTVRFLHTAHNYLSFRNEHWKRGNEGMKVRYLPFLVKRSKQNEKPEEALSTASGGHWVYFLSLARCFSIPTLFFQATGSCG